MIAVILVAMAFRLAKSPFYANTVVHSNAIGVIFSYVYHTKQLTQFKTYVEQDDTEYMKRYAPYMSDTSRWYDSIRDFQTIEPQRMIEDLGKPIAIHVKPQWISEIVESIHEQLTEASIIDTTTTYGVDPIWSHNSDVLKNVRNFCTYRAYLNEIYDLNINKGLLDDLVDYYLIASIKQGEPIIDGKNTIQSMLKETFKSKRPEPTMDIDDEEDGISRR